MATLPLECCAVLGEGRLQDDGGARLEPEFRSWRRFHRDSVIDFLIQVAGAGFNFGEVGIP
jgi:hypothetical protein